MLMDGFRRRTAEEILHSIYKLHSGKLKVYIGPVSGSGKTYRMLREGQSLKARGIDVVACAVSTMSRPQTMEQLGGLERLPSIHWHAEGSLRKDLDVDALLERNPEVVLTDGLAHHNRPEAGNKTRLEDIRVLLSRGISVITTVNVYELEEWAEVAQRMTGIEAEYTVPADTLELADEVTLVDVTPDMVLRRLAEGHLKAGKDMAVFRRGNLSVLRELALRLVAEDVNGSLAEHREELGISGPSGAAERIMVSIQYHWNGSIYIRRGQQIAKRLNGELLVVALKNGRRQLSREEGAFRRNIVKLTEKVGGQFAELPVGSRRHIPGALVRHARQLQATRIVLGHSRHTAWQEFWRGSIINRLLKICGHMDLFLVADRPEDKEGRILPAELRPSSGQTRYRRLNEREVAEEIGSIRRGRFKVYIGAAPGVGKTYTMLQEGQDLLKKGIDVRIGLVETHGRRETLDQLGHLTLIPRRTMLYQGAELQEMDTEAILRLHPEVVLVDELAHTNIPGSRHKKRYEDVLEILSAGISVITTVNVQHLESLNDAVEQITGIRVRETVPDSILRLADEVQLIDVSPQTLQIRMREGKIYHATKVEQALEHFFKTVNLIALRELALREIADDVDERLESVEREASLRGPWRRREVILVCADTASQAERLIRRGFRTAYRLKAEWHVAYVQAKMKASSDQMARLESLERLTARLGGSFMVCECERHTQIAPLLIAKARELAATQLVLGKPGSSFYKRLWRGSVAGKVIRACRHLDILIVADYEPQAAL